MFLQQHGSRAWESNSENQEMEEGAKPDQDWTGDEEDTSDWDDSDDCPRSNFDWQGSPLGVRGCFCLRTWRARLCFLQVQGNSGTFFRNVRGLGWRLPASCMSNLACPLHSRLETIFLFIQWLLELDRFKRTNWRLIVILVCPLVYDSIFTGKSISYRVIRL